MQRYGQSHAHLPCSGMERLLVACTADWWANKSILGNPLELSRRATAQYCSYLCEQGGGRTLQCLRQPDHQPSPPSSQYTTRFHRFLSLQFHTPTAKQHVHWQCMSRVVHTTSPLHPTTQPLTHFKLQEQAIPSGCPASCPPPLVLALLSCPPASCPLSSCKCRYV